MKGRHEEKKTGSAAARRKTAFADVVIAVCVVVALVITGAVVWEYHRLREVMSSGVITALFGFWGGELLIVALRQIFGSDVLKQITMSKTEIAEDGEAVDAETEPDEETYLTDIFGGSI